MKHNTEWNLADEIALPPYLLWHPFIAGGNFNEITEREIHS